MAEDFTLSVIIRHFMHKVHMLRVDYDSNMEPIQKATKASTYEIS